MSINGQRLGVFAKEPRAGQVKTRLARETSPEWAAAVALAFLRDTLDRFARVEAERVLVFAPSESRPFFETEAQGRYRLVPQADGNLGQRLQGFLADHLNERVVVLGIDSPTLPLEYVSRAFDLLAENDVVLGPATDGGYYLLGCARRVPPIFDDIAWGETSVLAETMQRLDQSWRVALLPPWYDVDTLADWRMMKGHITALRRTRLDPVAPRTEGLAEYLSTAY